MLYECVINWYFILALIHSPLFTFLSLFHIPIHNLNRLKFYNKIVIFRKHVSSMQVEIFKRLRNNSNIWMQCLVDTIKFTYIFYFSSDLNDTNIHIETTTISRYITKPHIQIGSAQTHRQTDNKSSTILLYEVFTEAGSQNKKRQK